MIPEQRDAGTLFAAWKVERPRRRSSRVGRWAVGTSGSVVTD